MSCAKRFKTIYSCESCTNKSCPLRIRADREGFNVVSDFDFKPQYANGTVIDIGTTTVAALRLVNGKIKNRYTALNYQRHFGSDVISRINASNNGKREQLQRLIRGQINECISSLGAENDNIIICANTVMTSLFMGYDCHKLGMYPFEAQSLQTVQEGKYTLLGGISGFVGGDITAGLYMCGFDKSDRVNLFLDLGTNGEIAIGNCDKILCTSVAAGPAFEGGNISCGSGAVKGAVTSVSFTDRIIKTVGNEKPMSVCGSGIIDFTAELVKSNAVDFSGKLDEKYSGEYKLTEDISLTAEDIRNIQTAKSAVRTGIELIIKEYGANERDIENIFISGGFSKYLDIEKACIIGLLPQRFKEKYKCVGNSALGGGVKIIEDGLDGAEKIRSVAKDFSLAEKTEFNDMFMENMYF